MSVVLSTSDVELLERATDMLASPDVTSLGAWWRDVSRTLITLFGGDHAMTAVPGHGIFATNIDTRVMAEIAEVCTTDSLRQRDPIYWQLNAAALVRPRAIWSRAGDLRRAVSACRRSSAVFDAFRAGFLLDSANIDLATPWGSAGLCISFARDDREVDRSRALAQILAPSFAIAVRTIAREPARFVDDFRLTRREREIAAHLAERRANWEIAKALGISEHTVRHHAESIFAKLGVRSRRDIRERLSRPHRRGG